MPPLSKTETRVNLDVIAADLGLYPVRAFHFVQEGLAYTVARVHGPRREANCSRHVTGQQLCHGLREFAFRQWGFLALSVLKRWNITQTLDFGRIVFCLARYNVMSTTPHDSLEDFQNVYDFNKAFENSYRIPVMV